MSVLLMLALLLGQQVPPADLPQGSGARGTSQAFGTARYDAVGYASWYGAEVRGVTASGRPFDPRAITAAHKTLPLGSFVEVTALDTGRTILVMITDRGPNVPGRILDLSRGAAELLGTDRQPLVAVRVRVADPSPADQVALRSGRAASPRLDAPPQLVAALRKQLPASRPPVALPPTTGLATNTRPPSQPPLARPGAGRFYVQVAAFSSGPRAAALAETIGALVQSNPGLYRVRLGPFGSRASAEAARDGIARRGYGDARVTEE